MKRIATIVLPALVLVLPALVARAEPATVGIVAPLSGPMEILGRQVLLGAGRAAERAGIAFDTVDDACSAEGGTAAAERLIAAKVRVVVGFLCVEAIEAALPALSEAGIPVITPGVRADGLTDRRARNGWLVWRTAPRADRERAAISEILVRRWARDLFAIVDDGTIYGRELAESFRLAAEQAGLKPVFTDTYRPQFDNQIGLAGRLRGAGATHVFAGGNRDDIAILARDAGVIGYKVTIAGGEALRAAPGETDLAPDTLMIGLPEVADIATTAFLQAFEADGETAEGYVLDAYAAMQVALAAASAADGAEKGVAEALETATFKTEAGPIRFDAKGDRTDNPYRLFRFDGAAFVEVK
ncbi:MAG: branched-chain amino acid ABC transporter substrate-binding protein [Rhizobiaceae bacterium]